jgi:F-type H+-transporting ATPase subunit epsilon
MATVEVGTAEKTGKPGAGRLQCVVVTPERTLFDELVEFVALPLYDGELGVAPGRTPLIGRLGFGELRTKEAGATRRYFVDGGFAQVRDDVVTVLTNRAVPSTDVDAGAAARELEEANARRATSDYELDEKAKAVARARAQLRVAGHQGN